MKGGEAEAEGIDHLFLEFGTKSLKSCPDRAQGPVMGRRGCT